MKENRERAIRWKMSRSMSSPFFKISSNSSVGSVCLVSPCEWQHGRSHRYLEENGLAAMLAANRSAGVTPEVNLRTHVTHIPLPNANKAAHSSLKTQRRHNPNRGTNDPIKRTYILQNFLKREDILLIYKIGVLSPLNVLIILQMCKYVIIID